jgi:Holliday junction resolvase
MKRNQPTMKIPNLKTVTAELNQRAFAHPIGRLQEIRAELHHGGPGGNIFWLASTKDDEYAFHYGGRRELQFNIAWDDVDGFEKLRHGVAFSFEPNRNLPNPVEVLSPKFGRFNKFMRLHSGLYGDMRMWHYKDEQPSRLYTPASIPDERVTKGVFVFLGKLQPSDSIDYEVILNDFDRLLELYKFTENDNESQTVSVPVQVEFRPGFKPKVLSTIATQIQKQRQIRLRQNKLQGVLYRQLVSQFGAENVRAEFSNVGRTSVDIVVRRKGSYWFYEIKTADSVRECLREALGQLLEYAFWPPAARAVSRLIIVGEAVMDEECEKYLQVLKKDFRLPVEYQRLRVK